VRKRHGLNRTITLVGFPAGKEFRVKTTARNQLWQSDASYFFVVGWGWYYSILVLDDFSRFVLASDLKPDMTAHSISDVVEQAVEFTGMRQVPVEDRTKFLSDHGSGYLARVFEEYLRVLDIRHIYCAPHHPQTNGQIERFHQVTLPLVWAEDHHDRRLLARLSQRRYTAAAAGAVADSQMSPALVELVKLQLHRRLFEILNKP
jgi:transposase InsO family protein